MYMGAYVMYSTPRSETCRWCISLLPSSRANAPCQPCCMPSHAELELEYTGYVEALLAAPRGLATGQEHRVRQLWVSYPVRVLRHSLTPSQEEVKATWEKLEDPRPTYMSPEALLSEHELASYRNILKLDGSVHRHARQSVAQDSRLPAAPSNSVHPSTPLVPTPPPHAPASTQANKPATPPVSTGLKGKGSQKVEVVMVSRRGNERGANKRKAGEAGDMTEGDDIEEHRPRRNARRLTVSRNNVRRQEY